MIKKATNWGWALALTCLISNLSQTTTLVDLGLSSLVAMLAWGGFVCYCLLQKVDWKIGGILYWVMLIAVLFGVFVCGMEVLRYNSYFASQIIYPFYLSMFILFVCYNVGDRITQKDFELMSVAYIIGALVAALDIYLKYLIDIDLTDRQYAYDSKNSISQILLTAVILILMNRKNLRNLAVRFFSLAAVVFLVIVVLLLKSRATIIGMIALLVLAFIRGSRRDPWLRWKILGGAIAGALVCWIVPELYDVLIDQILLGNRDKGNLNDISSGRWDEWKMFFEHMNNNWVFGNGHMKRESLILTALLEFGVPIGSLLLFIAVLPLIWSSRKNRSVDAIVNVLLYVAFVYAINGIFEQLTPFGAGVKCYFLWMTFGIVLAREEAAKSEMTRLGEMLQGDEKRSV